MAYTDIDKSDEYFNTVLYTGDNTSSRDITGVGFQPDFTWIKQRSDVFSHVLGNSVSGDNKFLSSNGTGAEGTDSSKFRTFVSDGFQVGSHASVNRTSDTYVGWSWRGSDSTAVSNTDGYETSTVSANTTSGFSIVSWTSSDTTGATIGHGLGVAPKVVIIKNRDLSAQDWIVYHSSIGETKALKLNLTNAEETSTGFFQDTAPTSTTFRVGSNNNTRGALGNNMIAYCFAEKKGFSKAFSYTGNGSTDGSFTYLGFRPAFLIVKRTDASSNWRLWDSTRSTFNVADKLLFPDTSDQELTSSSYYMDLLSSGFKIRNTNTDINASGGSYIGIAFAENPFVTSTGIPTVAR